MNEQKKKLPKTHPINYVLLAVSLIIFGSLGLIFITQMELQPGWLWEDVSRTNSMEISVLAGDDFNDDGISDAIAYADVLNQDRDYFGNPSDRPNYGNIYALDGSSGTRIWNNTYNNPVKRVYEIMDVDGDGYRDYFAEIASVGPDWVISEHSDHPVPEIIPDDYFNILISGHKGDEIPIAVGDNRSFTNYFVHDLVSLNNLNDNRPDLVFLECRTKGNETYEYNYNVSSYFVNGTKYDSTFLKFGWIREQDVIPALHLFPYGSEEHILLIDQTRIFLLNSSESNFLDPIFNETITGYSRDYAITEDLNGDLIPEIFLLNDEGNVSIVNGFDGTTIRVFNAPGDYNFHEIDTFSSNPGDMEAFVVIKGHNYDEITELRKTQILIYLITETGEDIFKAYHEETEDDSLDIFPLGEDMDGDNVEELVIFERIYPWYSTTEVRRLSIVSVPENKVLAVVNLDTGAQKIVPFQDISNDGKGDMLFSSHDKIVALASSKPQAIWLSPEFTLGLPLFITLAVVLCIGIFLAILKGRKLSFSRKSVKEHKLTVYVNVAAIVLMSVTFLLFLIQLNIFNNTLIPSQNMTNIVISFLTVIITWYGTLPLTAALYNRFAPRFAYTFVKLRALFFKISKSYNSDILVVDMKDRKEIGTVIQLKRVILPLMLSIAIGFYAYGLLTPILGYPNNFEIFGSTEFFQFMNGYMLCCIFPMILTFLVFSFFISGNFLLDDAGVVYFRQSKKYRQPGDIEPISIWAQSIVKGIAGISAILTLINFLGAVDFSGFFTDTENITGLLFGFLITLVFFVAIPFLTAFSYVLLAGEVMEFSMDFNMQKLYSLMEKKGYDTTPRDITNIYPEGFIVRKKSITDDQE